MSPLLLLTSPHTLFGVFATQPLKFAPFPRRTLVATTQAKKDGDLADPPDRLISGLCYFYPFFDGIRYGKYLIAQYSPVQALIQPLFPAIKVFNSFPFNGFLVFLTLYFVVVRNQNFSRYVRFNTMQAIVLDVLLIFPDLLERSFNPGGPSVAYRCRGSRKTGSLILEVKRNNGLCVVFCVHHRSLIQFIKKEIGLSCSLRG